MSKKVILITVLCTSILAATFAVIWFLSPGIHFFWKFASFNLTDANCYILDYETQAVIGQTTLTMTGFELDRDDEAPYHHLSIPGYTDRLPEEDRFGFQASRYSDGDWYGVLMDYTDTNGDLFWDDGEPQVAVSVRFVERTPVGYILCDDETGTVFEGYFVCADNEEEALRIYQEYKEK